MSDTANQTLAYRDLWRSVIRVAVEDAVLPRTSTERDKARSWLTTRSPDLVEVCNLADFDPDYVIEKATRAIERCDELEAQGLRMSKHPQREKTKRREKPIYTHNGLSLTLTQWADHVGMLRCTIFDRLERGVPFDRAIDPTPLPRSHSPNLKPRKARKVTVAGMSKSLTEWAIHCGLTYESLIQRKRRFGTHEASIAALLADRSKGPGVSSDFPTSQGTGGGSTTQETQNVTFSKDSAE